MKQIAIGNYKKYCSFKKRTLTKLFILLHIVRLILGWLMLSSLVEGWVLKPGSENFPPSQNPPCLSVLSEGDGAFNRFLLAYPTREGAPSTDMISWVYGYHHIMFFDSIPCFDLMINELALPIFNAEKENNYQPTKAAVL